MGRSVYAYGETQNNDPVCQVYVQLKVRSHLLLSAKTGAAACIRGREQVNNNSVEYSTNNGDDIL